MKEITLQELLKMQEELQETYSDIWPNLSPNIGPQKLLWLIGEVGEVIDIIKKNSTIKIMELDKTRNHFLEELSDVFMFYLDVLLCYGVTAKELELALIKKYEFNKQRWRKNLPQTNF